MCSHRSPAPRPPPTTSVALCRATSLRPACCPPRQLRQPLLKHASALPLPRPSCAGPAMQALPAPLMPALLKLRTHTLPHSCALVTLLPRCRAEPAGGGLPAQPGVHRSGPQPLHCRVPTRAGCCHPPAAPLLPGSFLLSGFAFRFTLLCVPYICPIVRETYWYRHTQHLKLPFGLTPPSLPPPLQHNGVHYSDPAIALRDALAPPPPLDHPPPATAAGDGASAAAAAVAAHAVFTAAPVWLPEGAGHMAD